MKETNLTRQSLPGALYHIDIDGIRHVAAAVLAAQTGYCRDYISRLARQHRIAGRQVDRQWFIDERSFEEFCKEQKALREERRRLLVIQRRLQWGVSIPRQSRGL